MTEQENINNEVQIKLASHDEKFNTLIAKIDATNTRIDDFIGEMRQQNEMRANEIAEMRQSFQSMQNAIASMQNQNIFVIIGVVAIAVAVFLK